MNKPIESNMFWKALIRVQEIVLVVSSVSAVLLIVASVVARYILKTDFFGMEDVLLISTIWMYFVGSSYGSYEDSHIKADILTNSIKNENTKKVINLIEKTVSCIIIAILAWWCIDFVRWNLITMPVSPALKIPLITSQSAVAIGFVLMFFFQAYHLYKAVLRMRGKGYSSEEKGGGQ